MASKVVRFPIPEGQKYCFGCNTLKTLEEFHRHRNRKDGRATQCILCCRARHVRHTQESSWVWRHRRNRYLRQYGSSPPWQEFERLWTQSGGHCYYCDVKLTPKVAWFDHKTPYSRGGSTDSQNLAVTCESCNRLKATMNEAEFWSFLREYIPRIQGHIDYLMGNRAEGQLSTVND